MLLAYSNSLDCIATSPEARAELVQRVFSRVEPEFQAATKAMVAENDPSAWTKPYAALSIFIEDEECGASLRKFIQVTVDAFFDNDLLFTTKTFLSNAKGSFGLMISSSLDAHKQVCFAARGQSMSIAFCKFICYCSDVCRAVSGCLFHECLSNLSFLYFLN